MSTPVRTERDFLGEKLIPAEAYWGVHTARAVENFPISGTTVAAMPDLIRAFGYVKKAAARANRDLGVLDAQRAHAIMFACERLIAGEFHDQFVVDVIQGGAGTSTNMNANEVLANLALEKLGWPKGAYAHLHPNDDVNQSQSTNDAYPTAVRVALQFATEPLIEAVGRLRQALDDKGREFSGVLKMGRTQLQDAVPMTLGQEFEAFGVTLGEDIERLREVCALLCEVNLGGTAIGTGLNAPAGYARRAVAHLAELSGLPMVPARHLVEATSDMGAFVLFSGVLKRLAVKLSKIANDLRLLSSGPRGGLNEINLPPMQPGSSIMPGKVNPVIPEAVNQVAFQVIANDLAVTLAAEAGQLQLNAMEPLIVANLLQSLQMLAAACHMFETRCIRGIEADTDRCRELLERSIGVVTALVPHLGYATATRLAAAALQTGQTVRALVLAEGLMDAARLDEVLSPAAMLGPGAEAA